MILLFPDSQSIEAVGDNIDFLTQLTDNTPYTRPVEHKL